MIFEAFPISASKLRNTARLETRRYNKTSYPRQSLIQLPYHISYLDGHWWIDWELVGELSFRRIHIERGLIVPCNVYNIPGVYILYIMKNNKVLVMTAGEKKEGAGEK